MNTTRIALALVAAASLSLACEEEEDTNSPPVPKKATAAASADIVEPEKKDEGDSYSYEVLVNGVPRRDPFKTYFDDTLAEEKPKETDARLTDLQRIEIDRLKLVAVVVGTATPMALVEDPSGTGHTLKIGTLLGKRLGQVKHIRRGEIVVQEEFRDYTGKRIPQLRTLKLEEPQAK
jgi:type IV pilus assembly protein PilP